MCPPPEALGDIAPTDALDRASAAFMAGRVAEAEAICDHILQASPDHLGARRRLGLVRLVQGRPLDACALLRPLAAAAPDDADIAIGLAEAIWASEGAATAIPHLRRAAALAPERVQLRGRLGLALLSIGDAQAAEVELRAVLAAQPDNAAALTQLGIALLGMQRAAEAAECMRRALALDATDPAIPLNLGLALRDLGRTEEALASLREAVARGPAQAHLHVALGDALFASGRLEPALAALQRAVALDIACTLAWAKLGDIAQIIGNPQAAVNFYRQAIALEPDNAEFPPLLGNALFATGATAEAAVELGRAMRMRWASPRPHGARLRVGILAAPGIANTPTDYIIDRARHDAEPIFMLPGQDYPAGRIAACYDVLFNAVSDPDSAPQALELALHVAPALGLPLINPPAAMPATQRHRIVDVLAGIPGLNLPRTIRLPSAAQDIAAQFAAAGGPVLLRPIGSHGGKGLVLAEDEAALRAAMAAQECAEIYLTRFVDFRSADGLYRKLRLVFVGGQAFPVHLAIGDHWLSHYFRTQMSEHAHLRAEEAEFLENPEAWLGSRIWAALAEIPRRVGLDYLGLDGAVDPDGNLLVFECNATMLVRHADKPALFDYKRRAAERIRAAMSDLLERRRA